MRWRTSLSEAPALATAIQECAAQLEDAELGPADLVLVFVSSAHRSQLSQLPALALQHIEAHHFLGCSGAGIIGQGREVEHSQGVSVTAAWLPGVEIQTFQLQETEVPDLDGAPDEWHRWLGVKPGRNTSFILLADPYTFPLEDVIEGLDFAYPGRPKVGGMAGDAPFPGGNALLCDNFLVRSGLVGVALTGTLRMDTVVAQGCRPVGRPLVVTGAERNHVTSLNRRSPMDVLRDLVEGLPPRERKLAGNSLFLGIQLNDPFREPREGGEFLIRNLIGVDHRKGDLVIAARPRVGQTVQFHLRDARASAEDLDRRLTDYRIGSPSSRPAGALLFSCTGRGDYLYGEPDHDSRMFFGRIGHVPLGGFFCNGEVGPVGGTTYLHGYTSCFALFRNGPEISGEFQTPPT